MEGFYPRLLLFNPFRVVVALILFYNMQQLKIQLLFLPRSFTFFDSCPKEG